MSDDLQQIVNQIFQNPDVLKTGVKIGRYSVTMGKIWRGALVIGYVASNPIEGEKPQLMHTSQTTPEEAQIMQAPAPEAAAEAPVMGINSPEGEQAQAPETGPVPGPKDKISPTGDVSPGSENGDNSENEEDAPPANPKSLDRPRAFPPNEPALFLNPGGRRLSIRSIDLALRRLGEEADIAVSAHTLRHPA